MIKCDRMQSFAPKAKLNCLSMATGQEMLTIAPTMLHMVPSVLTLSITEIRKKLVPHEMRKQLTCWASTVTIYGMKLPKLRFM